MRRRAVLRPAHRPLRPQEALPRSPSRSTCSRRVATAFSIGRPGSSSRGFFTGAGIGGEYAAINSAIDELIPARARGRVDLIINGCFWLGAAVGALLSARAPARGRSSPLDVGWRVAFGDGRRARRRHPARPPQRAREPALALHPRPREGGRGDRRRDRARVRARDRRRAPEPGDADHGPPAQADPVPRDRAHRVQGLPQARGARALPVRWPGVPLQRDDLHAGPDADHLLRRRARTRSASSTRSSPPATSSGRCCSAACSTPSAASR